MAPEQEISSKNKSTNELSAFFGSKWNTEIDQKMLMVLKNPLLAQLLERVHGGKGMGLIRLRAMELPVPSFFILTTDFWKKKQEKNISSTEELDLELENNISLLEKDTGKKFGDPKSPLFVSIRSGAPVSMPGQMKTFLNVGLNDQTFGKLCEEIGEKQGLQTYLSFIKEFAVDIFDLKASLFSKKYQQNITLQEQIVDAIKIIQKEGYEFPQNPREQVKLAVQKVFDSWDSQDAKDYRFAYKISDNLGTACVVQEMVFGNTAGGGSGVLYTRNPRNLDDNPVINYETNVQGPEVVGDKKNLPKKLENLPTEIKKQLEMMISTIKTHELSLWRHHPGEFEFVVDSKGKLYCLQGRNAFLTNLAQFTLYEEYIEKKVMTEHEVIESLSVSQLVQLLDPPLDQKAVDEAMKDNRMVAVGESIAHGIGAGKLILDNNIDSEFSTDPVILIGNIKNIVNKIKRNKAEIAGLIATDGNLGSHATNNLLRYAKDNQIPVIIGTEVVRPIKVGSTITIDGQTGRIFSGKIPREMTGLAEITTQQKEKILRWIKEREENPWDFSNLPGKRTEGNYFQISKQVKEEIEGYISHKAKETVVAQTLLKPWMMPSAIVKPDEIGKIEQTLKEIIENNYDASIRTGHSHFLPAGGPWMAITDLKQISDFLEKDYKRFITPIVNGDNIQYDLTEIILGKNHKDKLSPDPKIKGEHGAFTLSCSSDGYITLNILPHTPLLREIEESNPKSIASFVLNLSTPTHLVQEKISKDISENEDSMEIVNYIYRSVINWIFNSDLVNRLAAINSVFPSSQFSPTVLEGQVRTGEHNWIGVYGIKADPKNNH